MAQRSTYIISVIRQRVTRVPPRQLLGSVEFARSDICVSLAYRSRFLGLGPPSSSCTALSSNTSITVYNSVFIT